MPRANEAIEFSLEEVGAALAEAAGCGDGWWEVGFIMETRVGNLEMRGEDEHVGAYPGLAARIKRVQLLRVPSGGDLCIKIEDGMVVAPAKPKEVIHAN